MNTVTAEIPIKKLSRPALLVILCVSTFIISTITIIANLSKYSSADNIVAMNKLGVETTTNELLNIDSSSKKYASSLRNLQIQKEMVKTITPNTIRTKCIYLTIASILLFGAVLMFSFKRTGFYFYVAGTAVWIIGPIVVYGFSSLIFTNLLLGGVWIIFAILYGKNLKYMR